MLATVIETEANEYIERFLGERDNDGHRLVVRNGRAKPPTITTGFGEVEVHAPRINGKRVVDGQRCKFTSKILPPYMRKSPKVAEVLPVPAGALEQRLQAGVGVVAWGQRCRALGERDHPADGAVGWEGEHKAWTTRDLSDRDSVHV